MVSMSKSQRTRNALREVALRHFVAEGFEAASVTAIAAEVGVTERTFYRHFATKDEVLFGDVADRLHWFRTALRERPVEEDLLRSVLVSLGSPPTDPQVMVEIARLRTELLSPDRIERVYRDLQGTVAAELRLALAARGHDRLSAAVAGEAVAGAVLAAILVWTEAPPPHDLGRLGALTEAALEQVRPVLSRPSPDRPPGPRP